MWKALRWTLITILGATASYVVACAPVKFSAAEDEANGIIASCHQTPEGCVHDYVVTVGGPKIDILFVNDNSASMSFEQKALANRFSGFIQLLDTHHVDYRIAMTTTDVHITGDDNEPRGINGHGALQNGNLISFGPGMNYLTPSIPDRVSRFAATIVRPETATCENFIANYINTNGIGSIGTTAYQTEYKQNCPSGDERGTYAANLTIKNNPGSFMRSDAYLAIIFLSDEDVRSGLYCGGPSNQACSQTGFPIQDMDQPLSLFNTFKAAGKHEVAEVHSIIVKDSACLAKQNDQVLGTPPVAATRGLVRGSYGTVYQTFTSSSWGVDIDICSLNYTTALQPITNKIVNKSGEVLKCDNPLNLQITPIPADPGFSYSRNGRHVTFNKSMPVGSQIRYVYSCPYSF